ncbi:MAG: hypothetical protein JHD16_08390, partial [Solirubrobacteraceae bacterium]|nr:hypothetical protein [Solirubrobacteraceae bacterium]
SLTITALAEHAMSTVPPAPGRTAASIEHIGVAPIVGQTARAQPLPLFVKTP